MLIVAVSVQSVFLWLDLHLISFFVSLIAVSLPPTYPFGLLAENTDAQGTREPRTTLYLLCTFDSISHDKLWVTMIDMGYPLHLIDLLTKLYRKQLAKVKVAGTLSEWFRVKKGARQGCVLSPYLFNVLAEMVMRETLDGFQSGLQIGERMITNICYADDIILLATTGAELQELVDRRKNTAYSSTSTRPR